MIPVLVVIAFGTVKEATAYRSAEELEAAFVAKNKEYGRETNSDEMDDGYVDIEDAIICMIWAGQPESADPTPDHDATVLDWRQEVCDFNTRLGYSEWMEHKREEAKDECSNGQ